MKNLVALTATMFICAGCGGGSGSSTPVPVTPSPTPAPIQTPTPIPTPIPTPPVATAPLLNVKHEDTSVAIGGTATPNAVLDFYGIYSVANDQWGNKTALKSDVTYTQYVSGTLIADNVMTASWTWDLPEENGVTVDGKAKGFPAIIAGRSPNIGKPAIAPKLVTETQNTSIKYDLNVISEARSSTMFDITFTNNSDGALSHLTTDISIGVLPSQVQYTIFANMKLVETVSIDGQTYQVIEVGISDPLPRRSIWFNILKPNPTNTMHLKSFVDYMISKGYLSASDYLAGIEFGTEVIAGKGNFVVKEFTYTP